MRIGLAIGMRWVAVAGLALGCVGCGAMPKRNAHLAQVVARSAPTTGFSGDYPRFRGTEFLALGELRRLVADPGQGGALGEKLARFFRTPIVSNEAYFAGARPRRAWNPALGEFLRVATWNIEKSLQMPRAIAAVTSPAAYARMIDGETVAEGSLEFREMMRQRERLAGADILLLQEMDIGVSRSGYLDAARAMAQALGMNYAYAPQQLEIDPVLLGLEPALLDGGGRRWLRPDPQRYKGVFGIAVLSRYPIRSAQCFQLQTQAYDWHRGEFESTDLVEDVRRAGAEAAFATEITHEVKGGGRIFFRVDLEVPGVPGNTVTVVHNHLEIKATPLDRDAQMAEILSYIRGIDHTVVMGGDFNSAPSDLSPTSATRVVRRTATDPQTWVGLGLDVVLAAPAIVNYTRVVANATKNFHSPLAPDVPVVFPNKTRRMFERIEAFRFADGGAFDFRGDSGRSINRSSAKLANSNEKARKGQTPSFTVRRPVGPIGRYRLDWIFVKSLLGEPQPADGPYRLAPHFGETLVEFNEGLAHPLSDHRPCVVDIPFGEPPLPR